VKPYVWSCHACGASNAPDATRCTACGFAAVATGHAIASARATRQPPADADVPAPHLTWIFEKHPAKWMSDLSVDDAVERLREATRPTGLGSMLSQAIVATVTADSVKVQRDSLMPGAQGIHFAGRFDRIDGRTVLRGAFTVKQTTRVFLALWFACMFAWTAVTTIAVFTRPGSVWYFPVMGLGLLAAGAAVLRLLAWQLRRDQAAITNTIADAVSARTDQAATSAS
jgi:hypothetical protein